jgi:hypothetical protein
MSAFFGLELPRTEHITPWVPPPGNPSLTKKGRPQAGGLPFLVPQGLKASSGQLPRS